MDENALHGWDDEKVYYLNFRTGKDHCVSDEPDLVAALEHLCDRYFRAKDQDGLEPERDAPGKKSIRKKGGRKND